MLRFVQQRDHWENMKSVWTRRWWFVKQAQEVEDFKLNICFLNCHENPESSMLHLHKSIIATHKLYIREGRCDSSRISQPIESRIFIWTLRAGENENVSKSHITEMCIGYWFFWEILSFVYREKSLYFSHVDILIFAMHTIMREDTRKRQNL